MVGLQVDETDWENMTTKELHDKFQQMMGGQVQDVLNRFEEAMEKIDGIEKTFIQIYAKIVDKKKEEAIGLIPNLMEY